MRLPATQRLRGALLVIAASILVGACGQRDPVSRGKISAFDTTMEITLIGVNRQRAVEIASMLESDMQMMESAWHAWKPGPVARMNTLFNESNSPFPAPPSVLPLLRISKTLSEQSEDLFNPAIGHLFRAWGFQGRPAGCLRPPPADLIDEVVRAKPSMRDIEIEGFRISSSNQTVKLDFRDIQKGFAIDRAISRLQEMKISNASISTEGNLRAIGSRDGHPWSVPVRGPGGSGVLATLQIRGNEAAFTAAAYKHSFSWEGKRYHDIIDPRTGYPAEGASSVTVLHPNATTADAAATALFVAGRDNWVETARTMQVELVMLIDTDGVIHMNPAMRSRIQFEPGVTAEISLSEPLS